MDPAIAFSQLSPEEQQQMLNGPGLPPPTGIIPNFDNPPSRNGIAHGALATCISVTAIFVFLAVYAKVTHFRQIHFEDYLALSAIIAWAVFVGYLYGALCSYGYFIHQWDFRLRDVPNYLYFFYADTLTYFIAMSCIKAAIVLEWTRLFTPRGTRNLFFWICHTVAWLNFSASIVMLFLVIFPCKPREKFWNPVIVGTCSNALATVFIAPIMNLVFDVIILCLPHKIIWGLRLSLRKRIGLGVIFALGVLACLAAGMRIQVSLIFAREPDQTYNIAPTELWCLAEMSSGILIYCIPAAPMALKRLKGEATSAASKVTGYGRSLSGTQQSSGHHGRVGPNAKHSHYKEIDELPLADLPASAATVTGKPRDLESGPLHSDEGIMRTTQVSTVIANRKTGDVIVEPNAKTTNDYYVLQHPWESDRN